MHSCVIRMSPSPKTQALSAINSSCQWASRVSTALPRKKKGLSYIRKNSELSNKNNKGADPGGEIAEGPMSQGASCIRECSDAKQSLPGMEATSCKHSGQWRFALLQPLAPGSSGDPRALLGCPCPLSFTNIQAGTSGASICCHGYSR